MRVLVIVFLIVNAGLVYAFKPGNCESVLERFLEILIDKGELTDPKNEPPGEEYKDDKIPIACIAEPSNQTENAQWLIHMNKDNVHIIVQKTNLSTFEISYYGPFMSAYRK